MWQGEKVATLMSLYFYISAHAGVIDETDALNTYCPQISVAGDTWRVGVKGFIASFTVPAGGSTGAPKATLPLAIAVSTASTNPFTVITQS